jgi:hypothetical protein
MQVMQLSALGLLTLVSLAALPLGDRDATPVPVPRVDGYTIAMRVTTTDAAADPVQMTLKVAGGSLRIEMDGIAASMGGGRGGGSQADQMSRGAYMLLQDGGKVAMILPSMPNPMGGGMGMGVSMDVSALTGGMGMAVPEASNVNVDVEDLGAGESILGFPTRKYRLKQAYTTTGRGGGAQDVTTDVWMTTSISGADAALRRFSESFGSQYTAGSNARGVVDALSAKMPQGFPMKSVATERRGNGSVVTTMEVTELTKTAFSQSEFDVPSGIQLIDMNAMMGGRGRGR